MLKNEPFTPTEGIQPTSPLLNGKYTTGQFTHKIYHLARYAVLCILFVYLIYASINKSAAVTCNHFHLHFNGVFVTNVDYPIQHSFLSSLISAEHL